MHALFSRRFIVSSSSQLTKSLMKKKKLAFSHWSQSRYILSHLLPSGLASSSSVTRVGPSLVLRSEKINRFFVSTLRRSLLETRAGFFDPQLPPKPWVFTGFQKRGWYCFLFTLHFLYKLSLDMIFYLVLIYLSFVFWEKLVFEFVKFLALFLGF